MATARRPEPRRRKVHEAAESSRAPAARTPADWRDAITLTADEPLALRWIAPEQLDENPENWRLHPAGQMSSLGEVLGEVGWAGAALYNLETRRLVDGHARKKIATPGQPMPVLVGRWTIEQERKILATLDPIAGMAQASRPRLKELLGKVKIQTADLDGMLQKLKEDLAESQAAAAAAPPSSAPTPLESEEQQDGIRIEGSYAVLCKCESESDQKEVLRELQANGLDVRALTVGFPDPDPVAAPSPTIEGERLISRETKIVRSPRVIQLEGQFDLPAAKKSRREWVVDWDLESRPWSIGLIVGPSGSGKSSIARDVFGDRVAGSWAWPSDRAIVDGFPAKMSIVEISQLLASVGFNSQPAWCKPYGVLSNGERFRVDLARAMAESDGLSVVDEFSSVVDRQVAQIGSAALARTIRATGRKFVAVTCHYDVAEWLQPDWIADLGKIDDRGRVSLDWGLLRRRPEIPLSIRRAGCDAWPIFRPHHYLSGKLHRSAKCFVAEVDGRPAAFCAVLWYPSQHGGGWWRGHRTVCLPDFQGVGIGHALAEFVAAMFSATGKEFRSTTGHPSMVRHRIRSRYWETLRLPSLANFSAQSASSKKGLGRSAASARMTASFRYCGPARPDEARALGVLR